MTHPSPTSSQRAHSSLGRSVTVALILLAAASLQFAAGSPAGGWGYAYLITCGISALLIRKRIRGPYFLTLVGMGEMWLLLDNGIYGSLLCLAPYFKFPTGASVEDTLKTGFMVASTATLGFGLGVYLMDLATRKQAPRQDRSSPGAVCWGFGIASALALAGAVIFVYQELEHFLWDSFTVVPQPGQGKYSLALFALPTTLICFAYGLSHLRPIRESAFRWMLAGLAFAATLIPLLQGRRLMWILSVVMAVYLFRLRGMVRFRTWHIAVFLAILIPVSAFHEINKQRGWTTAFSSTNFSDILSTSSLYKVLDNSVGRFDLTAALALNREAAGFYWGQTFWEAPTYILPSTSFPRDNTIPTEIAMLQFGSANVSLVSYAISCSAEFFMNFSFLGVFLGMVSMGALSQAMDRLHGNRDPVAATGYALMLFRFPHHLVTAAYAWFPLTATALAPWLLVWALGKLMRKGVPRWDGATGMLLGSSGRLYAGPNGKVRVGAETGAILGSHASLYRRVEVP